MGWNEILSIWLNFNRKTDCLKLINFDSNLKNQKVGFVVEFVPKL